MARADEGSVEAQPSPHADEPVAVAGDYDLFFESAYPSLLRAALFAGATTEEAEDFVGEVMAYLFSQWGTVTNPWAYSTKAVLNRLRKIKKREKERLDRTTRGGHVTPTGVNDVTLTDWEEKEWVIQHLARLPLHQRAVMAYNFDGLSTDEIAAKLGKNHANVRKLLQLARERLRLELAMEQERDRKITPQDDGGQREETR
ncbi:RNA polymerase sigma factor [Micromonospora sp. WMMC250]|uniref:RNA polymerase sigma factor n=1 Tax=Micromonospora sp. WMMC250 TaxID=3014781 RepID=UPI0022B6CAFA|nr:sigma-70 family RNA polymerase sigma factor [Micromonospora sp. WMMC250]MCZ7373559.1 sigma-70 family RNA polymerase sigma factor [Micromonospora sp. WMMC250]